MSLPWKKAKPSRISRFMSEFQQSPKRGRSLVVETGFPTSLIDLFFKNRDRLKKSPSKRFQRIQRQIETAPNASSPRLTPPINPNVLAEEPTGKEKVNFVGGGLEAENKQQASERNGRVCGCDGTVFGAFVLMAFKVFIVAVLALSTKKKLTMGITLSAFALLLTELAAARVLARFKLCNTDNTQRQKPVNKNPIYSGKIETFDDSRDCCGDKNRVPEPVTCPEETEPVAVTEDSNSKDLRIRDLFLKDEKSTSKSSRLKSKIVKKLRSYKKKKETIAIKEETLKEVSSLVPEYNSEIMESEREEEKSNPPLIESKGDNMNGIVLIVIVLTGLLSGKILAFGLTFSYLFLRFGAAKKIGLRI